MKKNYILFTIICLLFSFPIFSQVTIGNGTEVGHNLPIEPYFGYSYSQSIYSSELINASGQITGLKYFATPETTLANSSDWVIYMGMTDQETFVDSYIPVSALTEVFTGTVTIDGGVVSITLDSPFDYDGISNLIVATDENQTNFDSGAHDFYATDTTTDVSIASYSDTVDYDPSNPPTTTSAGTNIRSLLPNIVFEGITQDCSNPIVNLDLVGFTSASLSWSAAGIDTFEYSVELAGSGEPTSGTVTSDVSIELSDLIQGEDYEFYLRSVCGNTYSPWASVSFQTIPVGATADDPIIIESLPYTTTDSTLGYNDDYDDNYDTGQCEGNQGSWLGGDDVVYLYTATFDGSINITLNPDDTWAGMYVFANASDINTACWIATMTNNGSSDELEMELAVTTGSTYYFLLGSYPNPQSFGYIFTVSENTCADPVIELSNVNCSADGDQYYVEVNITDMGSSSQYTITDDLGQVENTQATGVVTMGPYSGANLHIITVEGDDPSCNQTYTVYNICNDECTGAFAIETGEQVSGDTSIATNSGYNLSPDLWYSYTGDGQADDVTVTLCGSSYDTYIRIFDACGGTEIAYNDDDITCSSSTVNSTVTFPSDGTSTYYIMVEGYSSYSGAFILSLSTTLGIEDLESSDLKVYPNPVDGNYVTIQSPISGDKYVEIFDINGRRVLATTISGDKLDVSSINSGLYMVNITIDGRRNISKLIIE